MNALALLAAAVMQDVGPPPEVAEAEYQRVRFGEFATVPRVKAEFLVVYAHQSDIFRGSLLPWESYGNEFQEPTNDYVALGATVSLGRWEIDATHGVKVIDCNLKYRCDWEGGTEVSTRYYFLRRDNLMTLGTEALRIEPFATYIHQSDLFRGAPFDAEEEPTNDYFGVGVTLQYKKWEFDISHGAKMIDCTGGQGINKCDPESGTQVTMRWYPRRGVK